MKKLPLKVALTVAISAVLTLSGVTTVSAAEINIADLQVAANQPTAVTDISGASGGMYIVRLADAPVATYEGDISGYKATSAKANGRTRLDTNSKAAKKYEKYLRDQQKELLGNAGQKFGRELDTQFDYQHAINGFAVELTAAEAKAMSSMDGVISVQAERMEHVLTDVGPAWIGAPELWTNPPNSTQGEGVVVAILDTGINNDHPSFADVGSDGYDHTNPLGSGNYISGSHCDVVDPSFCNDKLIGAWSFVSEAVTPNDSDGHGSHTASTTAGNVVDGATLFAPTTSASFDISGVAPHANIIAYDVCTGGCPGGALVAAVNQVLIDAGNLPNGIAALNFSISGGGDPYNDAVELGFLSAVEAGVYVSASAGNAGPGASTVAHLGPWVSTTAASTHNRKIVNSLIDLTSTGSGEADISGLGFTSGYGPAAIIDSADLEGAFPGSTLCGLGVIGDNNPPWPPGTFNGEIVACTRGTYGRVEKGANVLAAGAGGYVLMDNGGGLVGDAHVLPGVHISQADGATLAAWLAANSANSPMATIEGYSFDTDPANGDIMAGFSSRGPQLAFDVNKPDITAPGVSVFAAEADGQAPAPEYQFLSGTSMSSPHNAGSGALMSAAHPDWTPQQIKSALMMSSTTEFTVKEDGVTPTDPFDLGAGRIELGDAYSAGLVMSESIANFEAADPALGGDPSTLNIASMMNSNCVGSCSWTRTVTNPTKHSSHWDVSASGDGFGVVAEVSPEANSDDYNLKLKKGADGEITVTVDTTLSDNGWHFGTVDLDRNLDEGPDLHMPIAVFAAKSTDDTLFNKTVDADTAAPGDILTYEISVTNGPLSGPITVTDAVPDGTSFVEFSETEVVTNGSTTSPWAYDGGSNSLSWTGELDPGGLDVSASFPITNYVPLSMFANTSVGFPGDCDDGAFIFNVPSFTYNGASYTQVLWSVNGTLEAGTASGVASSFANQNFPDATPPNNLLAPFWRDLNGCAGGDLRIAILSSGPFQWTVYEWEDVPHFGSTDAATFQVWVLNDGSPVGVLPQAHFTYGRLDNTGVGATVGAENTDGTNGSTYFFNGAGVAPAIGTDLHVNTLDGGSATLGFQVETDCSVDPTVNEADLSHSSTDELAIAVTSCP